MGLPVLFGVIRNIPDPSDALHIEDGAAEENKLYSNKVNPPKEQVESASDLLDEDQSTDIPSKTKETNDPLYLHIK